ncbi:xanthine dehydrogenase family protein molybdopterin-binding subunit [Rhodococcus zopfii]|uniref:xanthine dehydrogenase family protein molybdopterin-binding subunit n=1 Tax=Rhodococcus zopfii TaxID=43772 RepID=UPI001C3FE306|nr:molybdopterin cofactor-binding domain-containing protein [Rhodococcus zopfii]
MTPAVPSCYVGIRVPRIEDPRLLTGAGLFVDDVTRPGMFHACFVRSPIPRGRILSIDTSAAEALDGVHAVFVASDLNPRVREQKYALDGPFMPSLNWPPLADDEVRFVGDPVALVIARDRYIAEDAAELVVVDYDPLSPVVDYVTADTNEELVHAQFPGNHAGGMAIPPSDELLRIFDEAPHVVSRTVHQQAYIAVPMETRGLVAEWAKSTGEMTIWASTQSPHEVRGFCAKLLGIDEHRVRVLMRDTGGGFGQKVVPQREDICVMLAATMLPFAVKWIEDRQEHMMSAGMAREEHGEARMAFDADGRILAATLDHVQNVGAYPVPSPVTAASAVGMLFPGPYRIPAATFSLKLHYTNTVGRVAYRGPWQYESMAREVLLDSAARRIGLDPVELRRRNMYSSDEFPVAAPTGMPFSDVTPRETFEQALSMLGYDAFRREQEKARAEGRFMTVWGRGASCVGRRGSSSRRGASGRRRTRSPPSGPDGQGRCPSSRSGVRRTHRWQSTNSKALSAMWSRPTSPHWTPPPPRTGWTRVACAVSAPRTTTEPRHAVSRREPRRSARSTQECVPRSGLPSSPPSQHDWRDRRAERPDRRRDRARSWRARNFAACPWPDRSAAPPVDIPVRHGCTISPSTRQTTTPYPAARSMSPLQHGYLHR